MTADPPGRAPNPAFWAVQRPGSWYRREGWDIYVGQHIGALYAEDCIADGLTADAALAWLTDHRRRNPR